MLRFRTLLLGAAALLSLGAGSVSAASPFDRPSTLPYQAPDFGRIKDGDFEPAFATAMKQQLAEIDAIADNKAAPTFANTIVAMEKSGRMLDRVGNVFSALTGANTDDALEKVEADEAPKFARTERRDPSQSEALRPRRCDLPEARHAGPRCRIEDAGRGLLPPVRACRRASRRCRQGEIARTQQAAFDAGNRLRAEAARRRQGGRARRRQQGRAGRSVARGNRRRGPRRRKPRAQGQMAADAAEHHPAAEAPFALRPRHAREAVRQRVDARRKGGCQRHARHDRDDRHAACAQGAAARLPELSAYILEDQMAKTPDSRRTLPGAADPCNYREGKREAAGCRPRSTRTVRISS